jgi:hypothetical protein
VVRVPGYRTEMYCVSGEVRTEFIYVMLKKIDRLCGLVVRVPGYRSRGLWALLVTCVCCAVQCVASSDVRVACVSGGGFHQPVSAMLSGSAGSPFRSSSGHRAPWPPPALHAATEGKCREHMFCPCACLFLSASTVIGIVACLRARVQWSV